MTEQTQVQQQGEQDVPGADVQRGAEGMPEPPALGGRFRHHG